MNCRFSLSAILAFAVVLLVGSQTLAQDPTVVDSTHYTVEFENDDIRVLRIKYGPGETGVMHSHPAGLAVFLTDGSAMMTYPDGTTNEMNWPAGLAIPTEAETHYAHNTGEGAFELIQVELKEKMPEDGCGGY